MGWDGFGIGRVRRCLGAAAVAITLLLLPLAGIARATALTPIDGDARCPDSGEPPQTSTLHYLRSSMLCLINRAREQDGIVPLGYNDDLRRSATGHSNDMVVHHYFSHYGFAGSSLNRRVALTGYLVEASFYEVAENIGGGPDSYGSPLAVFRDWMHSAGHRANILDPRYQDFGVGVARGYPFGGGLTAATYTLDLALRR